MGNTSDNLCSYKEVSGGGLVSLTNPLSNQLFLLFKESDKQKWVDVMIETIDASIDLARKDNRKHIRQKIGVASYICADQSDLMDIQQKIIELYKDTGYDVFIDTSDTKLGSLPRSADIIIKISR